MDKSVKWYFGVLGAVLFALISWDIVHYKSSYNLIVRNSLNESIVLMGRVNNQGFWTSETVSESSMTVLAGETKAFGGLFYRSAGLSQAKYEVIILDKVRHQKLCTLQLSMIDMEKLDSRRYLLEVYALSSVKRVRMVPDN
jgi:hypothetical protein